MCCTIMIFLNIYDIYRNHIRHLKYIKTNNYDKITINTKEINYFLNKHSPTVTWVVSHHHFDYASDDMVIQMVDLHHPTKNVRV